MCEELLEDAKRYRYRAEELMVIADGYKNDVCSSALKECASFWIQMAETKEARHAKGNIPTKETRS